MTILRALLILLVAAMPAAQVNAADDPAPAQILQRLKTARPDLEFTRPQPSPIAGLYEVTLQGGGPTLYVTADGSHFVAGDLFSVGTEGFSNIAEDKRRIERRDLLAAVKPEDAIIFSPENPKATVTVFTDIDCGFCRKFHQQVPELNALGIAVRYLAFPRAGVDSPSFRKIATAWCSADRKDAITRMKKGETLPDNVCDGNPVAAEFDLGNRVGVNGTPALVLPDGTLVEGYRTAPELAHILGVN